MISKMCKDLAILTPEIASNSSSSYFTNSVSASNLMDSKNQNNKKFTAETTAMTIWVIITKLVNLGYELIDTAKVEEKLSNLKVQNSVTKNVISLLK